MIAKQSAYLRKQHC